MIIQRREALLLVIIAFSLTNSPFINLKVGTSTQTNDIIDSEDVKVSISKNATGLGIYSTLEFTIELTNTLSESVHDIKGYATLDSPYIELLPSTTPIFNRTTLEPLDSVDFPVAARVLEETTTAAVDVLLIIDASGSMGDEIASVKEKLTEMINALSTGIPELRMGVIVYGWNKYSENPMSRSENQLEFTSDLNAVKDFINSLYADGSYEPWGAAFYLANSWDWRTDAEKLIILIGDEDCDPSPVVGGTTGEGSYNGSDLVGVVTDLKDKGVTISTVVTLEQGLDPKVENQFGWIAAYTGGESVFLPELEEQGVDLPSLIQEWTLEMSREYRKKLNVTITWQDGEGVEYRNTVTEGFWLDFAFPSVVISETVAPTGTNVYSVEIIAKVTDLSEIGHVTLYHNADGGWDVVYMNRLSNSSYYYAELTNIPGQYNLTYFIEASDILNNVGTTSENWIIVQSTHIVIGEENSVWAESGEQIFSIFSVDTSQTYYLILSGEEEINSIIVNIAHLGSTEQQEPVTSYFQEVGQYVRKIIPFELSPANITLNMTIPLDLGDFVFSYVWITLTEVTGENYQGKITEEIRVQGLQWDASDETYFIVDYNGSSPLVIYVEVYSSDWRYLGKFTALEEHLNEDEDTYFVIIWATQRTGSYGISLSTEPPSIPDTYDTYYEASGATFWGGSPLFAVMLTIAILISLVIIRRRKTWITRKQD
ncbi:MAG: vWA domain-containing protein [Candidatus Hodarchaeales archaeon]|jgi:hypothetical protein